ncbi:MAG: hypothetical protein AAF960_01470 [Bacteroidota bacterium]
MKYRKLKIGLVISMALSVMAFVLFQRPIDLRPVTIKNGISSEQFRQGKILLAEMQNAYGGKKAWLAKKTGSYEQIAEWYGNLLLSGWDTLPQRFQMTSILGTDNSEMTLLNGLNNGQKWGVEDWKSYRMDAQGVKTFQPHEQYQHKLIYKNYWFQFPFRIDEAPIIAYAGESIVDGKTYDLLYATWGSESPNAKYDQYVLYLDKETKHIEWLNFTVREKFKSVKLTARFTDIKEVDGIFCPFSQYLFIGTPENRIRKLHENHYQWIWFG